MSKLQLCLVILIISTYLAQISYNTPFSNDKKLNKYEKKEIINIANNNKKTIGLGHEHLRNLGNKNKNLKNSKTNANKNDEPNKNVNTRTKANPDVSASTSKKDNTIKNDDNNMKNNNNENNNTNDFKIQNFIVLLILILIVVIALLIVIIVLMCKKRDYPSYQNISEESKKISIPQKIGIEESNETDQIEETINAMISKVMEEKDKSNSLDFDDDEIEDDSFKMQIIIKIK